MNQLVAFAAGSLVFCLLAGAVVLGMSNGRPWLGGVVMMLVGLAALAVILYRR